VGSPKDILVPICCEAKTRTTMVRHRGGGNEGQMKCSCHELKGLISCGRPESAILPPTTSREAALLGARQQIIAQTQPHGGTPSFPQASGGNDDRNSRRDSYLLPGAFMNTPKSHEAGAGRPGHGTPDEAEEWKRSPSTASWNIDRIASKNRVATAPPDLVSKLYAGHVLLLRYVAVLGQIGYEFADGNLTFQCRGPLCEC